MSYLNPDSEGALERTAIRLFEELGWQTANVITNLRTNSTLGRETTEQVVLERRLRAALARLNSDLPSTAIDLAVEEITRDRSVLSPERANHEVLQAPERWRQGSYRTDDERRSRGR